MDENKVIKMLLKHDEDIKYIKENMFTKKDAEKMTDTLDVIVKLVKKRDQEVTVLGHQVTTLRKEMDQVKPLVGLA